MSYHHATSNWRHRAGEVLAGGAATLSKNLERFSQATPYCLQAGSGAYVSVDAKGDELLLDTVAGLGPVLHGHADPDVVKAIIYQARRGTAFSLPHVLEIELAELIVHTQPAAEMVRFCKNGGDATQAAIRLARAVTNKQHVICSGYHGMHDWYISTTDNGGGVLPYVARYTHQWAWQDWNGLARLLDDYGRDLAAIIIEVPPIEWRSVDHTETALQRLQETCADWEAVFVIDEVVTMLREGLGGAHGRYGIIPDLICGAKALGNGLPCNYVAGHRDIMQMFDGGRVFLSTTFGGEALSLAAAYATIEKLRGDPGLLPEMWARGYQLGDHIEHELERYSLPGRLLGNGARMVLTWPDPIWKTVWLQETLKQGVLYGGPTFPMTCWTHEHVEHAARAASAAFQAMHEAVGQRGGVAHLLEGPPAGDVFSARYQEDDA